MELRLLRSFLAVAETGHVGRAAIKLHLSQPPLTRQIRKLEESLGVKLFERTASGMELTEAGTLYVTEARNILALSELARERAVLASRGEIGRIDIGVFGSAVFDQIPRILRTFRRRLPGVQIAIHSMGRAEQVEALRQRRLSVGFNRLLQTEADLESRLVCQEPLYLATAITSATSKLRRIRLEDLADEEFVVYPSSPRPSFIDHFQSLCRQRGFEPKIVQAVGDTITGLALVGAGFGACIVPASLTRLKVPGVRFRILDDRPPLTIDLSVMFRRDDRSPMLAAFLATVSEIAATAD